MFNFVCLRNVLIYFNLETKGESLDLSIRKSRASVSELSPISVNNPVENFLNDPFLGFISVTCNKSVTF
jgi:hypothetical protein